MLLKARQGDHVADDASGLGARGVDDAASGREEQQRPARAAEARQEHIRTRKEQQYRS